MPRRVNRDIVATRLVHVAAVDSSDLGPVVHIGPGLRPGGTRYTCRNADLVLERRRRLIDGGQLTGGGGGWRQLGDLSGHSVHAEHPDQRPLHVRPLGRDEGEVDVTFLCLTRCRINEHLVLSLVMVFDSDDFAGFHDLDRDETVLLLHERQFDHRVETSILQDGQEIRTSAGGALSVGVDEGDELLTRLRHDAVFDERSRTRSLGILDRQLVVDVSFANLEVALGRIVAREGLHHIHDDLVDSRLRNRSGRGDRRCRRRRRSAGRCRALRLVFSRGGRARSLLLLERCERLLDRIGLAGAIPCCELVGCACRPLLGLQVSFELADRVVNYERIAVDFAGVVQCLDCTA